MGNTPSNPSDGDRAPEGPKDLETVKRLMQVLKNHFTDAQARLGPIYLKYQTEGVGEGLVITEERKGETVLYGDDEAGGLRVSILNPMENLLQDSLKDPLQTTQRDRLREPVWVEASNAYYDQAKTRLEQVIQAMETKAERRKAELTDHIGRLKEGIQEEKKEEFGRLQLLLIELNAIQRGQTAMAGGMSEKVAPPAALDGTPRSPKASGKLDWSKQGPDSEIEEPTSVAVEPDLETAPAESSPGDAVETERTGVIGGLQAWFKKWTGPKK
ncbi:hypothetical protein IPG41_04470 [Candidatus Peregrinibacteria bacterium]|nr:MAG: hypothetical protein IPG41_04470 [Candidatus Peregrinibacteria bacterium]